jgi:hypothetical protein
VRTASTRTGILYDDKQYYKGTDPK